jgi:ribosomal-protein-alanine N-acetyltransferase
VNAAPSARHVGTPSSALLSTLGAIEAACFDRPWGASGLAEVLAQAGAAVVYLEDAPAYCLYQRVVDEVEILQLCTHPTAQRQGLGRRLVAAVLDEAEATGCVAVFLEVRASNRAAIALYEGAGFAVCGVRRGYYPALGPALGGADSAAAEDALLLRCDLPRDRKSR